MGKLIINFTSAEKRKLWKAGMSLRRLEDYSVRQILDAVSVDSIREKEIRKQFFGYCDDNKLSIGLENILGGGFSNGLYSEGLLGISASTRGLMDISSRVEKMLPSSLWKTLEYVERSNSNFKNLPVASFRDSNLSHLFGSSSSRTNLESIRAGRQVLDAFRPISERLNEISVGISSIERMTKNGWITGYFKSPIFNKKYLGFAQLSAGGESILSKSLLGFDSYKKLEIGTLANVLSASTVFEKRYITSVGLALDRASSYTRLAEANLGTFQWDNLGIKGSLSRSVTELAQNRFLSVSEDFSNLMRSIGEKPNWIYQAPESAKVPAQDYFLGARILKIVSADDEETAPEKLELEIVEENRDAISRYLPEVHKDLPDLWHGAVQAMYSDNPDKIRHVITSLRELYTHVLHLLVPDDAFLKWDEKQEYYQNSRPTRRGRFLYLCRNLNGSNSQFAKLLKTEIDATLAMIDLFQGGTHSIKSTFTPYELEFIKIKADTTLRTFLMLEFEINRR